MKRFADTAEAESLRRLQKLGLVDGVTTNPTLVAATGRPHHGVVREICELVRGPVSAEVHATDSDRMLAEARELAAISPNVVVKLPMTLEGLAVVHTLDGEGIQTNVTLCFSPLQAVLAAKAGATYVSPFVGRLDDVGHDGMGLVEQIVEAYGTYDFDTQVLVASVRSPAHVVEAIRLGADAVTVPPAIVDKLIRHPLTDAGLERFTADAAKIPADT